MLRIMIFNHFQFFGRFKKTPITESKQEINQNCEQQCIKNINYSKLTPKMIVNKKDNHPTTSTTSTLDSINSSLTGKF